MSEDTFRLESREFQLLLNDHGDVLSLNSPVVREQTPEGAGEFAPSLFGWSINHTSLGSDPTPWIADQIESTGQILSSHGRIADIQIELQVILDRSACTWVIALTNNGRAILETISFALRMPEPVGNDLHCTFPYCAGWTLPLAALDQGDEFILQYPAKGAMQWVSVYTEDHGLYFGVHDPLPLYKELVITSAGGLPSIQWRFNDIDLAYGERISLPPVQLAIHRDSWRGGAQIYRNWVTETIKRASTPRWYRRNPSWAWVGLKGQHAEQPWHKTDFLPAFSKTISKSGVDLSQLTAYTEDGHDTLYPDYWPGESVGGAAGLVSAVTSIHKQGRKCSLYVNGRIVDPRSSLDRELRERWGGRASPEADPLTERYGEVVFDVMCPGALGWQELFINKLLALVRSFDLDGFYIDQVCGARSFPCYATDHDHDKPNLAWASYLGFLKNLRSELQRANPSLFLATEGVNDLLGQYFDSMQAHNDWISPLGEDGRPLHELFRFTIPGPILNVGCIREDEAGVQYLKLAHLTGGGCDFGVWEWGDLPEKFSYQVRQTLSWHERHIDLLDLGEMRPIATNQESVQANGFTRQEKTVICAVHSNGGIEPDMATVTFQVPTQPGFRVRGAAVLDGTQMVAAPWEDHGSQCQITIPLAEIMGVEVTFIESAVHDNQLF